jgi:hypothetical protein
MRVTAGPRGIDADHQPAATYRQRGSPAAWAPPRPRRCESAQASAVQDLGSSPASSPVTRVPFSHIKAKESDLLADQAPWVGGPTGCYNRR